MRDARHHDCELVTAEPRHHAARVEQGRHAIRYRLQQVVAGCMAEKIVDLLEAVEIEAEHGELFVVRVRLLQFLIELCVKVTAIGKLGERVVMRKIADMLFGGLARAQVAYGDDVMWRSAVVYRSQDNFDGNADPSAWRSVVSVG